MKNELLKSAAKSKFYERFSHEMRTSLTGVIGFSEYIEHSTDVPMVQFAAKVVNQSGKDILRMTTAYFDFLRLQAGELRFQSSAFNVAEVMNEVMLQARESADLRSVKLILNCDSDAWGMRAVSDLNFFQRAVGLVLQDFISTSSADDLILIEVCQDGFQDYFQLRFLKTSKEKDSRWLSLYDKFWNEAYFSHEKQEGPGVCAVFAKDLISGLLGHMTGEALDEQTFVLVITFPVRVEKI